MEERPVPKSDVPGEESWPTQPFPTKPPPFARQALTEKDINPYMPAEEQALWRDGFATPRNEGLFTPPSFEGTVEIPGSGGGASWATAAVDPTKGMMYIVSQDAPTMLILVPPDDPRAAGGRGHGSARGKGSPPPPPRTACRDEAFTHYAGPNYDFMSQTTRLPSLSPPWFQMTAYDLNTGTIKWQVPNGGVAGGRRTLRRAPFPARRRRGDCRRRDLHRDPTDRKFRAYDQDTGKVIWEYTCPRLPMASLRCMPSAAASMW